MSIWRQLLGGGRSEAKAADFSALTWGAMLGGPASKAGVPVNVDTALRVTTVLSCCRVLAEGVAQLPLHVYQRQKTASRTVKRIAEDHDLYRVLYRRPNPWQTSFEWRESSMYHAVLTHGAFSFANRAMSGKVLELIPLMPGSVRVVQEKDYSVWYEMTDRFGQMSRLPHLTDAKQPTMFHLRGPSWNTYSGMEMLQQAREAIGLSIAFEESLGRLHSNGSRPSGILSTDQKLGPEQIEKIRRNFQETYAGLQNAFRTILLDAGMKFSQMSITPVDSQTHESRKHQIEEIARAFRVFPQMIGYADKTSTYASAEQFFLGHVIHSLGPWLSRWEQVISRDLLTEEENEQGYFARFDVADLLRGDAASRAEFYASGIVNGWMTRNEARHREDYDPIDGLDDPLVPLNMGTPADQQALADEVGGGVDQKALSRAITSHLLRGDGDHATKIAIEGKVRKVLAARSNGQLARARAMIEEVLQQVEEESPRSAA